MRIDRFPQIPLSVSLLLVLASCAVPARAATSFYACFGPATVDVSHQQSRCMAASTWVKLISYSMQNPPATSGKNGQTKAPATVSMMMSASEASAPAVKSLMTGTHLKSVTVTAYKDANSAAMVVLVFSEALITSKQFSGSSPVPVMSLSMSVNSVSEKFETAGSPGPPK